MNLGNLRTLSRSYCPSAKPNVISNTNRDIILQDVVYLVARLLKALPVNETFNVVADQREYDLNDVVTRYLDIDKSGLWWYNGSQWKKLYPRTKKWLDIHKPNWRDSSSGDPVHYYIDGHTLGTEPPADTAGTDYFRLYFFQKPEAMSQNTDYPFGKATEISRLTTASEAILMGWRWRALRIVGKAKGNEILIAKKDFFEEIALQDSLINKRLDIAYAKKTKFQGVKIRS